MVRIEKKTKWTLVQHSGFGYGHKPAFKLAVETRMISGKDIERVKKAGGLILDYNDAEDRADAENYPDSNEGLIPTAQGTFSKMKVDYLAIYVPKAASPSTEPVRV